MKKSQIEMIAKEPNPEQEKIYIWNGVKNLLFVFGRCWTVFMYLKAAC